MGTPFLCTVAVGGVWEGRLPCGDGVPSLLSHATRKLPNIPESYVNMAEAYIKSIIDVAWWQSFIQLLHDYRPANNKRTEQILSGSKLNAKTAMAKFGDRGVKVNQQQITGVCNEESSRHQAVRTMGTT